MKKDIPVELTRIIACLFGCVRYYMGDKNSQRRD